MKYRTDLIQSEETFKESFQHAVTARKTGYVFAMLTDRIELLRADEERLDREELYKKALEIRVFDTEGETKWFRSSIGNSFRLRERNDGPSGGNGENVPSDEWWDEEQYLDIDDRRPAGRPGYVRATGGGIYPLPLERYKDAKIKIRNYLEYEEDTGELYISDWRIVGFTEGKEG